MERPIVAFLTDFGHQDPYVAAMKGAVLSICREAALVDVVHEIPPQDVPAAALCLEAVFRHFPPGTVFVVVVDPGVGSERRALAARAGGRYLVGPDNGVLSLVLWAERDVEARAITNPALVAPSVSATFHGRDVFGPVAAHLACGLDFQAVGPNAGAFVTLSLPRPRLVAPGQWLGEVIGVDRFGNLTTSFSQGDLSTALSDGSTSDALAVLVEGVTVPIVRSYFDGRPGQPCALVNSTGRLELAVNGGNAAALLGVGKGTPVRVQRPARVASGSDVL